MRRGAAPDGTKPRGNRPPGPSLKHPGRGFEIAERIRREYETHLQVACAGESETDDGQTASRAEQDTALRLALLAHKRATVVRLRDDNSIDDSVLRRVQARLDNEEVRLSHNETTE
ncbi:MULTISPECIES: hypothetical protein [Streptomyces]|uniref:Uncharacterized protein n=2 Tax=Streptomyces TaxID=1883 RepID=A0ABV9IJL7_9ACTN